MLDADTKHRIDTARDILVGKVPDPKSQVEQITIALIYKFMDDMDAMSESMGGKRQFFAGEFARYAWRNLVRPGIGGQEVLRRYSDAVDMMTQNPGIPQLFRNIFNNAYLPYRDPETLRAFLKTIDGFSYHDSEKLGDAFEYLLSVMDSQGDAGQFRTPRHIIDFIVEIVDPKKDETILDPACGTAGFLISAYKHILNPTRELDDDRANPAHPDTTLTSAEREALVDNIKGYDISPDMVRLSLVNLYLHDFPNPQISEYDTLTSEDNWNHYANVILANPPFMTPKGGIRPHSRFGVKSRRSEVLFVDYMAEHLTPSGRAGIIVPEGIIFQTQNAHKQLRKMLIEDCLVAVISLPPGIFNPYSGVKTSILILDKALAKQTDSIAFFKVENDGYDLGAQRRPIDSNDLPRVKYEIQKYLCHLRAGEPADNYEPSLGLIVKKSKIAADGDYNMSGERYRERGTRLSQYPIVVLGDVADVIAGQSPPGTSYNNTGIGTPFYQGKTEFGEKFIGEPKKWTTDPRKFAERNDILMSVRAPVGPVNLATQRISIGRGLTTIRPAQDRLLTAYAFYTFRSIESEITGSAGAAFASINKREIEQIQFPLPPLDVQKEIVVEIEGYQRVIDGARMVVENYRPHIVVDPEWEMVEVWEVFKRADATVDPKTLDGSVTYIGLENITRFSGEIQGETVLENPTDVKSLKNTFYAGDILYGRLRPNLNKVWQADRSGICSTDILVIQPSTDDVNLRFYTHIMRSKPFNDAVLTRVTGAQLPRINWASFSQLQIPLPSLATQEVMVAEIDAEQALVNANRELVQRMERKIQDAVGRVWGD